MSHHRTDYNLYEGWELVGYPEKVFLRGKLIVDGERWLGRGVGDSICSVQQARSSSTGRRPGSSGVHGSTGFRCCEDPVCPESTLRA